MQIMGTTVGRGPEAKTADNTREIVNALVAVSAQLAAILTQLEYQSKLMHARMR